MTKITVAATQMTCHWPVDGNVNGNIENAEKLIRKAAGLGANLILIQELFETPYFCIEQDSRHFELATTLEQSPAIKAFQKLAKELQVVLPCSWFEKSNKAFFNSLAMIDADGSILGTYRKSHIPNGPGYQEKQYFNPGDSGFKVWNTQFGNIGCGICWDQWFPEAARCMALQGAELLLYPTAIGSEPPPAPPVDSSQHWKHVMMGHAAANIMPVISANRIGREVSGQDVDYSITFYGNSFITDHTGSIVEQADDKTESILIHTFDLQQIRQYRESWGVFRDRRPELYQSISTLDGKS